MKHFDWLPMWIFIVWNLQRNKFSKVYLLQCTYTYKMAEEIWLVSKEILPFCHHFVFFSTFWNSLWQTGNKSGLSKASLSPPSFLFCMHTKSNAVCVCSMTSEYKRYRTFLFYFIIFLVLPVRHKCCAHLQKLLKKWLNVLNK